MLGYDWPRLHAALNDLPAALLVASVLFDLLGTAVKRESLKAAGFWTLLLGVVGLGLAIGSGLMSEGRIDHTDRAHAVMETHETLGYIVLAIFGPLALWRLVRRGVWGAREQPVALTAGVIGVALLTYTSKLGGNLVFEHALGLPTTTLHSLAEERGGHEHGEDQEHEAGAAGAAGAAAEAQQRAPADSPKAPGDTAGAAGDTAKAGRTHVHADGTRHTHD